MQSPTFNYADRDFYHVSKRYRIQSKRRDTKKPPVTALGIIGLIIGWPLFFRRGKR